MKTLDHNELDLVSGGTFTQTFYLTIGGGLAGVGPAIYNKSQMGEGLFMAACGAGTGLMVGIAWMTAQALDNRYYPSTPTPAMPEPLPSAEIQN